MYGQDHVAPEQARAMLYEDVYVKDEASLLRLITERADALQNALPKAFENALATHDRDIIRYKKVRRGDVQPRVHRFNIGDYVYMSRSPLNNLDVSTTRTILRVKSIASTDWLELEGSDGQTVQTNVEHCAP